jgi:hypothetical protein
MTFVTNQNFEATTEFSAHQLYKIYKSKGRSDLEFYCMGCKDDQLYVYVDLCTKNAVDAALKKLARSGSIDSCCNTPEELIQRVAESLSASPDAVSLSFPKFENFFLCPDFGVNFPRLVTEIRLTGFVAPPQVKKKESKPEPELVEEEEKPPQRKRCRQTPDDDAAPSSAQLSALDSVLCRAPERRAASAKDTWEFLASGFEDLSKGFRGLKLSDETLRGMMLDVVRQLKDKGKRGQAGASESITDEEYRVKMLAQEQLALLSSEGSFGDLKELSDSIAKSQFLERFSRRHFKGTGHGCSGYASIIVQFHAFDAAYDTLAMHDEIQRLTNVISPHMKQAAPAVKSLGEELSTVASFRGHMHHQLTDRDFSEAPQLSDDEAGKYQALAEIAVINFSHCHAPRMRDREPPCKLKPELFLHEVGIFIKSRTIPSLKPFFSHPRVCRIFCEQSLDKVKKDTRTELIKTYMKNPDFVDPETGTWLPPAHLVRLIRDIYNVES